MRNVTVFVVLALFFAATAQGQLSRVLLINLGPTDVQVEDAKKQVHSDLEPGASKFMPLEKRQWIRMGQEMFLFDTAAIKASAQGSEPVVQVGPGAKLFLLPPGTSEPTKNPPKQPSRFPLRPLRKVDLT